MIISPWHAFVVLLLASCTGPAHRPMPTPPTVATPPPLNCRDSQNGDDGPPPDLETLLDAAALPTRGAVLQVSDHGDGWLFAKVGLYVRPHLTVELSVESTTDAELTYGPGERSRRVVLPQCTFMPGRWIVYTGGYYVRNTTCLPIRLRANGNEAEARVPVGASCQ